MTENTESADLTISECFSEVIFWIFASTEWVYVSTVLPAYLSYVLRGRGRLNDTLPQKQNRRWGRGGKYYSYPHWLSINKLLSPQILSLGKI